MKQRNFVAAHMNKVNRPTIHVNRKRKEQTERSRREVAEAKRSWLNDLI